MVEAAVLERTAPLYDRVRQVVPPMEWPFFAGDVDAIVAYGPDAARDAPVHVAADVLDHEVRPGVHVVT